MPRSLVVLLSVLADSPTASTDELWPAQVLLWNLVGVVVLLAHPYVTRWWDRRRGRLEEPTRFLTWPVCRKVFRHPELPWTTLKRIDQAEACRAIARLEAWQARNVATVQRGRTVRSGRRQPPAAGVHDRQQAA
jgi:hypothetical protein